MILLFFITAAAGFGAGICYEACRPGGTLDLHQLLNAATRPPIPSNVRVLPRQRGGAA